MVKSALVLTVFASLTLTPSANAANNGAFPPYIGQGDATIQTELARYPEARAHLAKAFQNWDAQKYTEAGQMFWMAGTELGTLKFPPYKALEPVALKWNNYTSCMDALSSFMRAQTSDPLDDTAIDRITNSNHKFNLNFCPKFLLEAKGMSMHAMLSSLYQRALNYNPSTKEFSAKKTSKSSNGGDSVLSACLVVGKPINTGVGCGMGKVWVKTFFKVSTDTSLNCPSIVKFSYVDENGPTQDDAPTDAQVCGGPPTNIKVIAQPARR